MRHFEKKKKKSPVNNDFPSESGKLRALLFAFHIVPRYCFKYFQYVTCDKASCPGPRACIRKTQKNLTVLEPLISLFSELSMTQDII